MIRYVAMLPFDKLDTAILLGVRRVMPIAIANELVNGWTPTPRGYDQV